MRPAQHLSQAPSMDHLWGLLTPGASVSRKCKVIMIINARAENANAIKYETNTCVYILYIFVFICRKRILIHTDAYDPDMQQNQIIYVR